MISLFLQFEFGKIKKYFSTKASAKIITSALFITVFLLVAFGIYHFFVSSFRYIMVGAEEDIRLALSLFLYEVFLCILGVLLILSALISSLFSLFRSRIDNWILSSPEHTSIPVFILLKSLANSLLPVSILFFPALLALQKVYSFGALGFAMCLLSIFILLASLNLLTHAGLIIITFVYYKVAKYSKLFTFNFKGLVILVSGLFTLSLYALWRVFKAVDLLSIFKGSEVSPLVSISNMASHFTYLPTHPFAMEIISWQLAEPITAYTYFSRIALIGIVALVFWKYSIRLFYPVWQTLQDVTMSTHRSLFSLSAPKKAFLFTGSHTAVLFKKELLLATRNYKDIMWFLFLMLIWLLQITANVVLNHHVVKNEFDISPKVISLHITQYIVALYFISAFTLRFVFPSFSTEKKTSWILMSAPLEFKKIFVGKLLFFNTLFVLIGICMSTMNSYALSLPKEYTFYSMILFICTILTVVTFGLLLSILYPNAETDDPEVITTSVPGLFFTAIALLYSGVSGVVLYFLMSKTLFVPFYLFSGISLLIILCLIRYMLRRTSLQ